MKSVFLSLIVSSMAFSQSSSQFSIMRSTVAGGGVTASTSSRFNLNSTIGQPLAAVPSSARFIIQGGFWIRPAPILFFPSKVGTNFLVKIQSETGKIYTLQYQDTLKNTWQDLVSIAGNGNVITITNPVQNLPQRFIRLVEQ